MKNLLASIAVILAVVVLGGLVFIYSGIYNVAADDPHWPATQWILETVRMRSIKAHAAGIEVPGGLDEYAKLVMGTEHFAAHCSVCHGGPGVPKGEIAHGLNPQPPDLTHASGHSTPSELFWILKHGVKMTGMPSWGGHSDEELWATVGFLEKLPGMSEQDYASLVKASMEQGGHH
jgi:mono/diheme cytochrome c family protein